jgi:hypothetical protein
MDTIARHPVTALLAVAIFVALSLGVRFGGPEPPRTPEPLPPPTIDTLDMGIGESAEYSGHVTAVEFASRPAGGVLVLAVGPREAVCSFPPAGSGESSPIAKVRVGDAVRVRGHVVSGEPGRVNLSGCTLIPGSMP